MMTIEQLAEERWKNGVDSAISEMRADLKWVLRYQLTSAVTGAGALVIAIITFFFKTHG